MGAPITLHHQNLYLTLLTHRLMHSSSCLACRKQVISKRSDIQLLFRYSCFPQLRLRALHKTLLNRGSCHSPSPTIELVGVVSLTSRPSQGEGPTQQAQDKAQDTQDTSNTSQTIGSLQGHVIDYDKHKGPCFC